MSQPLVPAERRPANHGPKVAARNRNALIAAAREIYATQGLDAPLSAIARRAGVGQGVLYRHFPDRAAVAIAVLEENVRQVEQAAAAEAARFADVLGVLTWHLTESAAFLGLLHSNGAAGHSEALAHALVLSDRVESALRRHLPKRHRLGASGDLMLAVAMVSGATGGPTREVRERRAKAAWRLLDVEVGPVRPFEG
ncbi:MULTISPECIES: TetR/AcrR family transcriptional regulator [unclassified Streptomyces]|uniref:TetR/AcrR family transcriptional regulator n=1 Tax=unclassified Streptomyces TaxID=2593676 RepID=UPI0004772DAA|nr:MULTISPECIES: TetR/AcrR family transcriptional regulator [unclassified Streptomyces]MYY05748.1 TetR family transcriptional regulator [Streptomyces sp. SID4913]